jgi:Kdo2-lipid IVA lauroyltransferase/acyltransferase
VTANRRKKRRKGPLGKKLRHARRHAAFAIGRSAVRWIGKLEIRRAQKLGESVGAVAFRVRGTDRRRALRHLEQALGLDARARTAIAKNMFRHFGRVAAEMAVLRRLGADAVDVLVEPDRSVAIVDEALAGKRGAILITPHLGHFELIAAWFARRGYQGKVVGARVAFDPYNAFLDEGRRNLGFETIFTDESPREILKVLRANGLVGMLPDQDIDKMEGVFVPFFGRPAYTPKGPVVLAQAARAALVPVFIPWIEDEHRYRLIVKPPVDLADTGDREQDVVENTLRWSRVFEAVIAEHPDQWPWIHRRWRTTPERLERAREKRDRKLEATRTTRSSEGS